MQDIGDSVSFATEIGNKRVGSVNEGQCSAATAGKFLPITLGYGLLFLD